MKRLFLFFFMIISSLSMPLMWAMDDPNPVPTDEEELSTVFSDERETQKIFDLQNMEQRLQNMAQRLKELGGKDSGMRSYFLLMLDQLNRDRVERGLTPIPEFALDDIIGYADSLWPLTEEMQSWLTYEEYPIGNVDTVTISPNGKYIWIKFIDGQGQLYDALNMQEIGPRFRDPNDVDDIIFSPDDRYILIRSSFHGQGDRLYNSEGDRLYNTSDMQVIGEKVNLDVNATFSSDGNYIWSEPALYDTSTMQKVESVFDDSKDVDFGPNNKYVFIKDENDISQLYDMSGNDISNIQAVGDAIKNVRSFVFSPNVFSPNGKHILIPFTDGSGQLYDTATMEAIGERIASIVYHYKFSPDGKYILIPFYNNTAQLYDTLSMQAVGEKINRMLRHIVFSSDSKYIIIEGFGDDREPKLYTIPNMEEVKEILFDQATAMEFSPDSNYIWIWKTNEQKLYSMSNMSEVGEGLFPFNQFTYLGFSPDSTYIWMKNNETGQLVRFNVKADQGLKKLTRDELKLIAYKYHALFNFSNKFLKDKLIISYLRNFPDEVAVDAIINRSASWIKDQLKDVKNFMEPEVKTLKQNFLNILFNESKTATELIPLTKEETIIFESLPQEKQEVYARLVKKWKEK